MHSFTLSLSLLALTVTVATAQTADSLNQATRDTTSTLSVRTLIVQQNRQTPPERRPVSVFTRTLDGLIPGLQSTNGGGQPGAAPELMLRGFSSYNTGMMPLIELNGTVYSGDIATLNPQDIDYITLLKSPSDVVIYGNRAANGILQIKTKSGIPDKGRLTIDAKAGIVTMGIRDYDKLDTRAYYETMYQALSSTPYAVIPFLGGYNAFDLPDNQLFTAEGRINPATTLRYEEDWFKETRRTGFRQDYTITTSDEGNKGHYYLSAGYLNEKGYIKSTGFERANITFNGSVNPKPWLKAGLFTTGATSSQHFIDTRDSLHNPFYVARFMPAAFPVYYRDATGTIQKDEKTGADKYDWGSSIDFPNSSMGNRLIAPATNIPGSLTLDNRQNKSGSWIVNPYLELTILKQLKARTDFQYNVSQNKQYLTLNPYYGDGAITNGREDITTTNQSTTALRQTLSWDRNIAKHNILVSGGYEYYGFHTSFTTTMTTGNSSNIPSASGTYSKTQEGFFLRGNYSFDEKYFLTAGARLDHMINRIPGNRMKPYWAVGAAYDISREPFLQNSAVNKLKLRIDYGTQGNNGLLSYSDDPFAEQIRQWNTGMDLTLFRALNISLDAYRRFNPLSVNHIPPSYPGGIIRLINMSIENKGLELSLRTAPLKPNRKLGWSLFFTAAVNRNKVRRLDVQETQEGSIYDLNLPEYAGPDPVSGQATYYINLPGGRFTTTDYGLLQAKDLRTFGSAQPDLYGSLTQTFTYKRLLLSIQLNYSLGGKYYDQVYAHLMGNGLRGTWAPDILDAWTPDHSTTDIPRVSTTDAYSNAVSNRFVRNASYLNIKNVYLGYNLPATVTKRAKLKTLTAYLTAENLWLFAAHKAIDPQASFNGMGGYNYLPARTIMIGISAGL